MLRLFLNHRESNKIIKAGELIFLVLVKYAGFKVAQNNYPLYSDFCNVEREKTILKTITKN